MWLKLVLQIFSAISQYLSNKALLDAGEAKALNRINQSMIERAKRAREIERINRSKSRDELIDSLRNKNNK